jgi:glutamate-1-semialdehyde 2,1-aminomutase
MLCTFFTEKEVVDYDSATSADTDKYALYFHAMQEQGIYLAPSQFETSFVSLVHTDDDIEKTIEASRSAFQAAR